MELRNYGDNPHADGPYSFDAITSLRDYAIRQSPIFDEAGVHGFAHRTNRHRAREREMILETWRENFFAFHGHLSRHHLAWVRIA